MVNIRQRELEEQQRNMVMLALAYVKANGYDYDMPILSDDFLADYMIQFHTSLYAAKRYFQCFAQVDVFKVTENKIFFTVNYEKKSFIERIFKISFPDPKPKQEHPQEAQQQESHP